MPRHLLMLLASLLCSSCVLADDAFIIGVARQEMINSVAPDRILQLLSEAGVDSVRSDASGVLSQPRRGLLHLDRAWLGNVRQESLQPLPVLADGLSLLDGDGRPPRTRKIVAGALTAEELDQGLAGPLIQAGLLEHVEGLSLHPLVYCAREARRTPEGWITWLRWIDNDLRNQATRPVPLYLSKMGWPSHNGQCGLSEQTQAAYLARSFFLARTLPDIKGLWWAGLVDGNDRRNPRQNFGLFHEDLTAKPAYLTLKAISATLHDYRYDAEKSRELNSNYLLRFTRGSEQLLVAWTNASSHVIQIDASSTQRGNVLLIDSSQPLKGQFDSGIAWQCNDGRCSAEVGLDGFPKIISLGDKPALFAQ